VNQIDDDDEDAYRVINIDESLAYVGYNSDFGPVNLAQVHRYCKQLGECMEQHRLNQNVKIIHHCSTHYQKQANACFLICAYQVMHLNKTPEQALAPFS
jgi:cell division cycle 14